MCISQRTHETHIVSLYFISQIPEQSSVQLRLQEAHTDVAHKNYT